MFAFWLFDEITTDDSGARYRTKEGEEVDDTKCIVQLPVVLGTEGPRDLERRCERYADTEYFGEENPEGARDVAFWTMSTKEEK